MWALLVFAVAMLLIPIVTGGGLSWNSATESLLETSFAAQRPVVHGVEIAASNLRVLHRWRTHVTSGRGGLLEADANWLCQTPDGLFVVAIGQGEPNRSKATFFSLKVPFEIRWTWRNLSEERVRQMLAATPGVYREVFGTDPAAPP